MGFISFWRCAINYLYFSTAEGIKKIDIANLVGESQTAASIILSTTTSPSIPDNFVNSLHGDYIDSNFYLTFSFKNNIAKGCFVVKNDTSLNQFSDGYNLYSPRLNNRGILYVINKDNNNIEVYYGAYSRPGTRAPDYIYSTLSTPSILSGDITCLHIANDSSSELANGTRLYIGTSLGLTMIDTYDAESSPGYCAGLDNRGISKTYSISGGIGTYKVLGGSNPKVVSVSSNEDKHIMFVATENSGLSQISTLSDKLFVFLTYENNLIPSNVIRDISGKTF